MIIQTYFSNIRKTNVSIVCCDLCHCEFERLTRGIPNIQKHHYCNRICKHRAQESLQLGEGNPFFGKHHSEATQKQVSEKVSIAWTRSDYREAQHARLIKQTGVKNPFFGKQHSEETRKQMSESRAKGISEGRIVGGSRGWKGFHVSSKTHNIERYDSFFELLRMRMLDTDHNVVFWTKKHGLQVKYFWDGKHRIYVPDFKIEVMFEANVQPISFIEEIKGYEDPSKLQAKLDALAQVCDSLGFQHKLIDYQTLEQMSMSIYNLSIGQLRRLERLKCLKAV